MSVTESKTKTPAKTSKKAVKPAESAALKAALEAAQIEMVLLSALVKSPLNVRTIPYPPESVREMADSILAVGLIQNLVVHTLPDGLSGVAAGGRRLAALQLLQREQRIDAGHQVIVKRVSDELAVVASMVENNNRVAMHPAEQISGFRTLSEQGKTPAQIGDQLGYSSRHVQRMLKLASLAPELIALLENKQLANAQPSDNPILLALKQGMAPYTGTEAAIREIAFHNKHLQQIRFTFPDSQGKPALDYRLSGLRQIAGYTNRFLPASKDPQDDSLIDTETGQHVIAVDQRAKMTRLPGFSASNFDHPGVCATIRFLDRRTWGVNHGNRAENTAHASGGRPVHQCHRQSHRPLSQYRSQVPSPTSVRAAQVPPPAACQA